ncbi:MAG TPA: hypothetical protein VMF29_06895 [Candidatus Edwardsbacteria bacterium]|nr:hypothetical protein [Candidatus Edwardsbacteria bacterium]
MKFFKSYTHSRLMPDRAWDDIFELLANIDSAEVEEWLDDHAQSGFTLEEFLFYLKAIDRDEVQDWLWLHRKEFEAVLANPSFNFDSARVMDGKERWQRLFLMSPHKPTDFKDNK